MNFQPCSVWFYDVPNNNSEMQSTCSCSRAGHSSEVGGNISTGIVNSALRKKLYEKMLLLRGGGVLLNEIFVKYFTEVLPEKSRRFSLMSVNICTNIFRVTLCATY